MDARGDELTWSFWEWLLLLRWLTQHTGTWGSFVVPHRRLGSIPSAAVSLGLLGDQHLLSLLCFPVADRKVIRAANHLWVSDVRKGI